MHIPDHFWTNTSAPFALRPFPTDMKPLLKHINSPKTLLLAQEHMHLIFWRWIHLERKQMPRTTPSLMLQAIRAAEHWPLAGQFFPTATLMGGKQTGTTPHADISVHLDFIDFPQQPLVRDVLSLHAQKALLFAWGDEYTKRVKTLLAGIEPLMNQKHLTPLETAYAVCQATMNHTLSQWYDSRPYLAEAFTKEEWYDFWKTQFGLMATDNGLSTDTLLDAYTGSMRRVFPKFSLTNKELGAYRIKHNETPDIHFMEQYEFWLSFGSHILLPLSLYLQLLEPVC